MPKTFSGVVDGPDAENESVSLSVRKISNGYLVSESHSKGSDYTYSENFSPTKPNLAVPSAQAETPRRTDSMARAVAMLNSTTKRS